MLLPSVGVNSFQGSMYESAGIGLRAGLLAGNRMGENWSLNVGFAFDNVNLDGSSTSYIFDLGFSPLIHFPQDKFEILVGPVLGTFLDKGSIGAIDTWAYGWTVGANLALLVPVGSKVRLGGLFNFALRNPLKFCVMDSCQSSGLNAQKALALSLAALF